MAQLPNKPNLEWLRKQAKRRLRELRKQSPHAQLASAQFDLATDFGFKSWRDLKARVDSVTVEGQMTVAAKNGDAMMLGALLDRHPEKLHMRIPPYEWTLLHAGARHHAIVDLLLKRGLDANAREKGDNTSAMHWAAAAGALDVVTRLADAGGDVVGRGDDHELEVIGWASCWEGCDDEAHARVRAFLISRGARHHIFSAIAVDDADEVRRIAAANPSALASHMSRNENGQTPLQFAVRFERPRMVQLLIELGADPRGVDSWGMPVAAYARTHDIDRPALEKIRETDFVAAVALGNWPAAERMLKDDPRLLDPSRGALHLMAKRGDASAVRWLIARGADPSARWGHWDAQVTPLHLACLANHPGIARALLDAGADPAVKDSQHDADALGWAEFFGRRDIQDLLRRYVRP